VAAVIGYPIRHSISPMIHNAAFRALDLDWVYVAWPVPAGSVPGALAGMRALGIEGLSVTMPHKAAVAESVDRLSPAAEALGAANTVVRRGEILIGDNTDGAGFLDALRTDHGVDPADRRCLVFGAGGAARAVILALADAGAKELVVVNRTPERAAAAAALAGGRGRVGSQADAGEADVLVNATPVGMSTPTLRGGSPAAGGSPCEPEWLHEGQVVVDLIYHPAVTPFMAVAREKGAIAVNGLGMLLHQAGHQFRLWTGAEPPLSSMSAAALSFLGDSSGVAD
jgi:shikimate dehydrogenase